VQGQSCAGIVNFWDIDDEHGSTQAFLTILNGINIGLWALSVLFLVNAFQFAVDTFKAGPHGRKQTHEGLLHLVGRMFAHMFSQGDTQLEHSHLDVPPPVGTVGSESKASIVPTKHLDSGAHV
jgi:hypothetical protein